MVECLQYNAIEYIARQSSLLLIENKIEQPYWTYIVVSRLAERLQISNNTVLALLQAQLHPRVEKETSFLTLKKGAFWGQ